jgi:hypothetical protein
MKIVKDECYFKKRQLTALTKISSVVIAPLGFVALARAEFTRKGGTSENYAKTQTSQQNCPVIVSNNEFSPNTTKHIY